MISATTAKFCRIYYQFGHYILLLIPQKLVKRDGISVLLNENVTNPYIRGIIKLNVFIRALVALIFLAPIILFKDVRVFETIIYLGFAMLNIIMVAVLATLLVMLDDLIWKINSYVLWNHKLCKLDYKNYGLCLELFKNNNSFTANFLQTREFIAKDDMEPFIGIFVTIATCFAPFVGMMVGVAGFLLSDEMRGLQRVLAYLPWGTTHLKIVLFGLVGYIVGTNTYVMTTAPLSLISLKSPVVWMAKYNGYG